MDQDKLLERLDKLSEAIIAAILTETASVSRYLATQVADLLSEFKQSRGRIVSSVENIKRAQIIGSRLKEIIKKSGYSEKLRFIIAEYSLISSAVNEYIATFAAFERKDLYKQVVKANIVTTLDMMVNTGLQTGFIGPVTNLLQKNITGGASIDDLRKLLRDQIAGTSETAGLLNRYANTVATDAVEQFTRNYIEVISQDLKLEYFLYAGTVITDSRDFCAQRTGKYYAIDQVRGWASLQWSGKNKATTPDNIRTLLGGYGCRHRLIPVSKAIYDSNR